MRLITRQEISAEFRIPAGSVDTRMAELGVAAYPPTKRGRGWAVLYDADEIKIALQNERETKLARKERRTPRIRPTRQERNILDLPWSKAKLLLTPQGPTQ